MNAKPNKMQTITQIHDEPKVIKYVYPDLGPIHVHLYSESKQIYDFLLKTKGIEHLENIEQLGALRSVHKASHHSRWEYMILQMYILEQLISNSSIGLKTGVDLSSTYHITSTEELIKSWVFLNNYGHLKDTFEAERVWFELILDTPELRQVFLDTMPDQQCKKFAQRILTEEDLFIFHHLITIVLLEWQNHKKDKSNPIFDLWVEMVKILLKDVTGIDVPPEGSKLSSALDIFHAIRRVSYVLLDINSSPLFLRVDSRNLLRNVIAKPDMLLYDKESAINRTLNEMDRLLFTEMYANEEVTLPLKTVAP